MIISVKTSITGISKLDRVDVMHQKYWRDPDLVENDHPQPHQSLDTALLVMSVVMICLATDSAVLIVLLKIRENKVFSSCLF